MILDSTYLFDLMADDPDAFEKGVELVERGEVQWLPTPVVAEAYYGVATARSETTEAELRNSLLGYHTYCGSFWSGFNELKNTEIIKY